MTKLARRNYIRATSQVKEHKVMHKVRKHWEVIGISALMMMAGGAVTAHANVHADSTNSVAGTQSMASGNSNNNIKSQPASIMSQAKNMKSQLMANSAMHLDRVKAQQSNGVNTNTENGRVASNNDLINSNQTANSGVGSASNESSAGSNSDNNLVSSSSSQVSASAKPAQSASGKDAKLSSNRQANGTDNDNDSQTLKVNTPGDKKVGQEASQHPKMMFGASENVGRKHELGQQLLGQAQDHYSDGHWIDNNGQWLSDSDITDWQNSTQPYCGLNYKWSPSTGALEFTSGTLQTSDGYYINSSSNGIQFSPVFIGSYTTPSDVNKYSAPNLNILKQVRSIKFDSDDNTSGTKANGFMFANQGSQSDLTNIKSIDLSHFNSNLFSDMSYMFAGNGNLINLDISNFNTSNVTNMFSMFDGDNSLPILNVGNFDTSNVTNMANMFGGDESLSSLNVSDFNTSNVTNMSDMFSSDFNLIKLNVNNFNTSKVKNMSNMFDSDMSLPVLDVSNFNTSNVTNMSSMFRNDVSLPNLDLYNFDTSNVSDMSSMFQNDYNLHQLDLSSFDTHSVHNMSYMFDGANNINTFIFGPEFVTTNLSNGYNIGGTIVNNGKFDIFSSNKAVVVPFESGTLNTNLGISLSDFIHMNPMKRNHFKFQGTESNSVPINATKIVIQNPNAKFVDSDDAPELYKETGQTDSQGKPYTESDGTTSYGRVGTFIPEYLPPKDKAQQSDKTITRTINYQNDSGQQVANPVTQSVTYQRTNQVNLNTGQIDSYGTWTPQGPSDWSDVQSPDLSSQGYVKPNDPNVSQVNVTPSDQDQTILVTYILAMGNKTSDKTVTRTINYQNGSGQQVANPVTQSITFRRTDQINLNTHQVDSYGTWMPLQDVFSDVKSPDLSAQGYGTPDKPTVGLAQVSHSDQNQTVTVTYPSAMGNKTSDQTIVRTITYVDQNGNSIASPTKQTVNYSRTDQVNQATGQTTYGDWTPQGSSDWSSLMAPDMSSQGYGQPNQAMIPDQNVQPGQQNSDITITYPDSTVTISPSDPGDPGSQIPNGDANWPAGTDANSLSKQIVRTIQYQNTDGQQVADPVTQNVTYGKTITIDKVTGRPVSQTGWTPRSSAKWDSVTSPDLSDEGYDQPNVETVPEQDVSNGQSNLNIVVTYPDGEHIVSANQPSDGISGSQLNKTVTRTITYHNIDGQQVINPVVQTANYTRNAIIDAKTHHLKQYTPWTSTNSQLSSVISPDLSSQGYTTPNISEVASEDTNEDSSNSSINVVYPDATHVVASNRPSDGINSNQLNKSIVRSISYQNENSQQVADPVTQVINYERNAVINARTHQLIHYTNWTSLNNDWSSVKSPDLSGQGYATPNYVTVSGQEVDESQPNSHVTVVYPDAVHSVSADKPSDGISGDQLNKSIIRSISYKNDDGQQVANPVTQTVNYERNAVINARTHQLIHYTDWMSSNDNWPSVKSPDLSDQGYSSPNYASVSEQNVDADQPNSHVTVVYPDAVHSVSADKPSDGISGNQLNKSITRLISYQNNGGQQVANPVTQTVNYERSAIINARTHQLIHYTDWVTSNNNWPSVTSPDLSGQGYTTPNYASVSEQSVDANQPNARVIVTYPDGEHTVPYNAPSDGVAGNQLNRTAVRTIKYENGRGQQIANTVAQPVTYHRDAVINARTHQLIKYTNWETDNDQWPGVVSPDLSKDGYAAPSPQMINSHDVDPDTNNATEIVLYPDADTTVGNTDNKHPGTVIDPNDPSSPKWPTGADHNSLIKQIPRVIKYENQAGQQIASPVTQNVVYTRTATVDKATGKLMSVSNWQSADNNFDAITSPDLTDKGYVDPSQSVVPTESVGSDDSGNTVIVIYNDGSATVTPSDNVSPNQKIAPNQANWPNEATKNNLVKTISRTVDYQNKSGQQIADPVTENVTYTRTATVDRITGKLIDYGDWESNDNEWNDVTSPDMSAKGYVNPSQQIIPSEDVSQNYSNNKVIITYDDGIAIATPSDNVSSNQKIAPNQANWPSEATKNNLVKTIDRTVYYKNRSGQQIASPVTENVVYTRTATVDRVTGKLIGYSDWKSNDSQWDDVTSPDLSAKGYIQPSQSIVPSENVGENDNNNTVTVIYNDGAATATPSDNVSPNQKIAPNQANWPNEATKNNLIKTIVRTVYYQNKFGQQIASPVTENVTYTRMATVDRVTGKLIGYSNWESNDSQWNSVTSPDLTDKGYVNPSQQTVPSENVDESDGNNKVIVTYDDGTTTATPEANITPGRKIAPNQANWPDGTDRNSLAKTIYRNIHYKNVRGQTVANSVSEPVNYTRTAIVDRITGTLLNYTKWISHNNQWNAVKSPDLSADGYNAPSQATVETEPTRPDEGNKDVTILYTDADQTVTPNNAPESGSRIDPNGNNTVTWPNDSSRDSMVKTIPRVIDYKNVRGDKLSPTITQNVTFTRNTTVDKVTGAVIHHSDWNTPNNIWNKVVSPDESYRGYQAPSQKQVDQAYVYPASGSQHITIVYNDAIAPINPANAKRAGQSDINPKDPNSPKWPAGIDHNNLVDMITRTIHYLDKNGHQVAPSKSESVTYERTGFVNKATGKLINYTPWSTKDSHWNAVISPDLHDVGYGTPDKPVIGDQSVAQGEQDANVNVIYPDAIATVTPQSPGFPNEQMNPKGHTVWPDGSGEDSLIDNITRTIKYQNDRGENLLPPTIQHVNYSRSAQVDRVTGQVISYSPWSAPDKNWHEVVSPIAAGYSAPDKAKIDQQSVKPGDKNVTDVVKYNDKYTIVAPLNAKQPGTKIDPNNPSTKNWPNGTDFNSLFKTVTRQVIYLDKQTGKPVAKPVEQWVGFKRTALVDETTGKIVGYSDWISSNSQLDSVVSPNLVANGYSQPSISEVPSVPVNVNSHSQTIPVYYDEAITVVTPSDHIDPGALINPFGTNPVKWPDAVQHSQLVRTVTRTIKFVDYTSGRQIHVPVIQHITYYRKVAVNKVTGKVVKVWNWQTTNDKWPKIVAPKIKGFSKPSIKIIKSVLNPNKDAIVVVKYHKIVKQHLMKPQLVAGPKILPRPVVPKIVKPAPIQKPLRAPQVKARPVIVNKPETKTQNVMKLPQTGELASADYAFAFGLMLLGFSLAAFDVSCKRRRA